MTNPQYNMCLTIFFISYSLFEVPSNMLLKGLKPHIWLPSTMVAWGICMTFMGFVNNYQGLLAARWFLGLAEAGLYDAYTTELIVDFPVSLTICRVGTDVRSSASGLLFSSQRPLFPDR